LAGRRARIAELPQMSPQANPKAGNRSIGAPLPPVGIALHALPGRLAIVVATGLIVAFAFGYLVGRLSLG
jgi:hypothetical protein